MRIKILPLALTCALTAMVTGCATPAGKTIKETHGDIADANATLQGVHDQNSPLDRPTTMVHKEQWVDTSVIKREVAPVDAPSDCEINYAPTGGAASVSEFVQILAAGKCHTLVRFDASAMRRLNGSQDAPMTPTAAPGSMPAVATAAYGGNTMLPEVPGGVRSVPYGGGAPSGERMIDLTYKGPRDGLFDRVATLLGLYYRRDGNRVDFFYTETKAYRINLKAEKTAQKSSVRSGMSNTTGSQSSGLSSQGSGQSSGGGSNDSGTSQNTDVEASQDIAAGIDKAVASMLSAGNVGRYSYVADTGQLIVTDTPDVQKNIAAYVESTNHIVTQQVVMQVTVATFQKSRSNHLAFSWDLVYKSLRGKGVTLGNQFPLTDTNGSSAGVQILDTAKGALGQFTGSSVVVDALNEQGVAKVVQSPTIYSLNMQPTPMQSGTQYTYLAESSNSITSGGQATGFSQTSLIPGLVTTGFNIVATPFVYEDGKTMTLSFSMNLSQLDKITDITSQDSKIQAPQVSNNIVVQKVKIRSGETMVISGMKAQNKKADESGVGNPKWWVFGGGYNHDESDTVNLIMVTPVIL